MNKRNPNSVAVGYAFIAVLMWSTVATAFNIALQELNYIQLLTYSSGVAFVVLSIIMLFNNRFGLLKTIHKNEYISLIIKGIINPFAYYLILFKA